MSDILDKIIEAKEKMGENAIEKIVKHYNLENYSPERKSASCPFHTDKTPSLIWNDKDKAFKCFSCSRRISILDMYIETEGSYSKAVKKLCNETGVSIDTKSIERNKDDYFINYKYPKPEQNKTRDIVDQYCAKRGISKETLDYMGVKQDLHGNVTFEFHDLDGTLVCKKYRLSKTPKNGMPKMWWDKDSDKCPVLYNIDKVDITKPIIFSEGMMDALSIFESGYTNVVSIPGGAEDSNWIDFNYEFLENVENIILWFDNDKAGQDGLKKVVSRLGEYRCKIVKPSKEDEDAIEKYYKTFNKSLSVRKTDANNILLALGKERVLSLINSAEEIPNKKLKYLMDCADKNIAEQEKFSFGINEMDKILYGNLFSCFTIYSGKSGCVDCDTEFFDGFGWKKISDYQIGDKVLIYDKYGNAKLEEPVQYHKYSCDTLFHFSTKYGLDQCLSPEHNVYYITSKGNLQHKSAEEIFEQHKKSICGFSGRFITTFNYNGKGIDLSDEQIELMCAIICDGSFYGNVKPENESYNTVRFHIKKQRKKDKLKNVFKRNNLIYREVASASEGYTDFYVKAPRREKEFTEYWYNCNRHQLQVVCDNILFWDGYTSKSSKSFSTTKESTANFVQFAFSSCGYRARVLKNDRVGKEYFTNGKYYKRKSIEYKVNITKRNLIGMVNDGGLQKVKINEYKTKDGNKYCFTTSTGMWIMRRNGCIVVTGNSGKSSITNTTALISPVEHGYKVFSFSGELSDGQLADWVVNCLAGYNHVRKIPGVIKDGSPYYVTTKEAEDAIRKYYKRDMILYSDEDALDVSGDNLLMAMEDAYKRHGCRVFNIDR